MAALITVLSVLFVIFAILLILVVIIQSQREGTLEMFGGSGNPFGVQSSKGMNKLTVIIGVLFIIIVFSLSLSYNIRSNRERASNESAMQEAFQPQVDADAAQQNTETEQNTDSSDNN